MWRRPERDARPITFCRSIGLLSPRTLPMYLVGPEPRPCSKGGSLVTRLFETLSPRARIIAYGVQDRSAAAVTNAMLIYSSLSWQGFSIDRWLEQSGQIESRRMFDELWSMVREGTWRLPIASMHALDEFGDALEARRRRRTK